MPNDLQQILLIRFVLIASVGRADPILLLIVAPALVIAWMRDETFANLLLQQPQIGPKLQKGMGK
jgi:hypothetical protein